LGGRPGGIQAETRGCLVVSPPRTRSSLRPIQAVRFRPRIDSLGVCSCHFPVRWAKPGRRDPIGHVRI
jgi:hypothetical protein